MKSVEITDLCVCVAWFRNDFYETRCDERKL